MVSYATMHCGKQGCRRGETEHCYCMLCFTAKGSWLALGGPFPVVVLLGGGGGGGGGGGLEGQKPPPPPPQTCSATPPGIMLGRYKISLMSSYLELGHTCATCKAR